MRDPIYFVSLHGTQCSLSLDNISWALEPSGRFSVRSLYRTLYRGTPMKHFNHVWKIVIPLKIWVFLWHLIRNRLPSTTTSIVVEVLATADVPFADNMRIPITSSSIARLLILCGAQLGNCQHAIGTHRVSQPPTCYRPIETRFLDLVCGLMLVPLDYQEQIYGQRDLPQPTHSCAIQNGLLYAGVASSG